jgi:hypothetical protein
MTTSLIFIGGRQVAERAIENILEPLTQAQQSNYTLKPTKQQATK